MDHANSADWPTPPGAAVAFLWSCPFCDHLLAYDRYNGEPELLDDFLIRKPGRSMIVTFPTSASSLSTAPEGVSDGTQAFHEVGF